MTMSITGNSIFDIKPDDWLKVMRGDYKLTFGDRYGSHADNGEVNIHSLNGYGTLLC